MCGVRATQFYLKALPRILNQCSETAGERKRKNFTVSKKLYIETTFEVNTGFEWVILLIMLWTVPPPVPLYNPQCSRYTITCKIKLNTNSLVVLCSLSEGGPSLLWKLSWLTSAPADALALGVVNVSEIIQRSSLPNLQHAQQKPE